MSFAVVLGLVYNYVPFVILAVYSALQRLDPSLAEASRDLGAGAWPTFLRITLPLTVPGVAAGAVFVFVLSIGNFVTPDLLGGGKLQMVGNLIYDQFLTARDWPFGATLSMVLIAVMMVLLFVIRRGTPGRRDGAAPCVGCSTLHLGLTFVFLYAADRDADGAVLQQGRHADRLDRIFRSTGTGSSPPAPRSSRRRAIR